jgi:transcriptional regulator with XRE-family HTH domain
MKTSENNIIGERLKSARRQLGFSRREFGGICGFSAATLQAWEDGKYPVPVRSIVKYVDSLLHCGLVTTPEWFVKGEGLPPRPISAPTLKIRSKKEIILREVLFFEKENENSIITTISDDSMLPFYDIGDFLGGIIVPIQEADKYIGSICIATISSGETLVRKLKRGSEDKRYNLISTNLDTNAYSAFLLNCQITQLAQIIWHRKYKLE